MMIIYNGNVGGNFDIWRVFRIDWGPLGYALASSLVHKTLSRPCEDLLVFEREVQTKNGIIVATFSTDQIIQKSHLEPMYALFHVSMLMFFDICWPSWRHNRPLWRHNRLTKEKHPSKNLTLHASSPEWGPIDLAHSLDVPKSSHKCAPWCVPLLLCLHDGLLCLRKYSKMKKCENQKVYKSALNGTFELSD
jgi:hypothetical protein